MRKLNKRSLAADIRMTAFSIGGTGLLTGILPVQHYVANGHVLLTHHTTLGPLVLLTASVALLGLWGWVRKQG